jgi:5-methylcytosine-specific restriction protein A
MALRKLRPLVKAFEGGVVSRKPKKADDLYRSPEHRAWREIVVSRARWQCEAIDVGQRCWKAEPAHRLFADHIIEVSDGGPCFDPTNGQCLCGHHHRLKTARAQAARAASLTP